MLPVDPRPSRPSPSRPPSMHQIHPRPSRPAHVLIRVYRFLLPGQHSPLSKCSTTHFTIHSALILFVRHLQSRHYMDRVFHCSIVLEGHHHDGNDHLYHYNFDEAIKHVDAAYPPSTIIYRCSSTKTRDVSSHHQLAHKIFMA